jgi:hypothetical protein
MPDLSSSHTFAFVALFIAFLTSLRELGVLICSSRTTTLTLWRCSKDSVPKVEKSEDASDKEEDADDEIDNDHIYMTLYNPSHPVSQV